MILDIFRLYTFIYAGKMFSLVLFYKRMSGFSATMNALGDGKSTYRDPNKIPGMEVKKLYQAPRDFSQMQLKVREFRVINRKDYKQVLAVAEYPKNKLYDIAVLIDSAILSNELIDPKAASDFSAQADNPLVVKSFNSNINVKVLSAIGNKEHQTVEITLLLTHKLVHQNICIGSYDSRSFGVGLLVAFRICNLS